MKEKLELRKKADRKKIAELLRKGNIGLFPTDTVWGICCSLKNEDAVKRIFEIKQREKDKPFLLLAKDVNQVNEYIKGEIKKAIVDKYWPGPLTIVMKANLKKVPSVVRAGKDTVAVRIPNYPEILEILEDLDFPIVAPSANLAGHHTPANFDEIDRVIVKSVDFIVAGECKIKKPSTIVDCSGEHVKVLRKGAIDFRI